MTDTSHGTPQDTTNSNRDKMISELNTVIDPAYHRSNRYRHGYANGVIRMLNLVFGEEKPPLEVKAYTDELTADANLGHEALVLCEAFVKASEVYDSAVNLALQERMKKLIEVWHVNTWTKANIPEVEPEKPKEPAYLMVNGTRYEIFSAAELAEIPEVALEIEDKPGRFFNQFIIDGGMLLAEFTDDKPMSEVKKYELFHLGALTGNVACLKLEARQA